MAFRFCDVLDQALVKREARTEFAAKKPVVWPSEASAVLFDQVRNKITGRCHLATFFRLIGEPITNPMDAKGGWRTNTGTKMEDTVGDLAIYADCMLARHVRFYDNDLDLSAEIDLVVLDPATNEPYIVECKNFDGYYAEKGIMKLGQPKLDHMMQISMYLHQIPTPEKLKQVILAGLEDRKQKDAAGYSHRNHIEANLELLEKMRMDVPVQGKLFYISRGECDRREFDMGLFQEFDGSTYPTYDGTVAKYFTIDSVFARYAAVQARWVEAKEEAARRLAQQGILEPLPDDAMLPAEAKKFAADYNRYWEQLAATMRNLPAQYFPEPEYEFQYSEEKMKRLIDAKELTKKATEAFKKKGVKTGDWQCGYCAWRQTCLKRFQRSFAHIAFDLEDAEIVEDEAA